MADTSTDNSLIYADVIAKEQTFTALADLGLSLDNLPIDKLLIRLIDLVDSPHLPILADSMSVAGVDGYWLAESDEARRNLIKGAYELHRYKGTPWAVKEIVRRLGFGNATLIEGFGGKQHNGEITRRDGVYNYGHSDRWAYYRIIIHEPITLEQANLLRKTLANLQETSTWEAGIYQLETSDPVMGGENGIDNRAPRQLANRTLWLKNELARQIGAVNSGKLGKTENAVSAAKLATARNIAMTGDGSWNVNFDGLQNTTGTMTLAKSGVTAGSYNSVTVDAKGRVIRGLNQTHGLVTATTATGTANVATGNGNTFLNIVASGVGQTASVGSSTQVTGINGITVSSDTAGKLIVTRDSNSPTATKLQTARTISLTGAVTGRVNFDGSRNVSMATTLTKAIVQDFNRTISGTATALGGTTNNIKMTGQVVVSADGLIRQYFHSKHFRDWWFGRDDNAVGYQNHDIANFKIPIALWTAIPNKVLSVQAQTMRSSDTASSAQFSSEAAEHEVAWAFRNQGIDKSNVWLNLSRTHGGASEHIDLFVIVEGY